MLVNLPLEPHTLPSFLRKAGLAANVGPFLQMGKVGVIHLGVPVFSAELDS